MTIHELVNYATTVIDAIKDVVIGSFGGIVAYMYDYTKQKKAGNEPVWSTMTMFINMFIGGFTANTFGEFIPHDITGRDGIVGLIGVSSYAILGLVESRFAAYFIDKFINKS